MTDPAILEHNLKPLEILNDFHAHPVIPGEQQSLTTVCPSCGGTLHVFTYCVMCDNKSCRFRAGTAIDLLSEIEGGYLEAIRSAQSAYPDLFPNLNTVEPDGMSETLRNQRAVLEFILRQGREVSQMSTITAVQATTWLRHLGITLSDQPFSIMVLERPALLEFVQRVNAVTSRPINKMAIGTNQAAVVIPLFANPAQLSGFVMFPSREPERAKVTCFGKFRFGFTGLLDMHPRCASVDLFSNATHALTANSTNAKIYRERYAVSVVYDPRSAVQRWELPAPVFHPQNESSELLGGIAEFAANTDLKVSFGGANPLKLDWAEYCLDYAFSEIDKSDAITPKTRLILSALKFTDAQYQTLIDELHQAGKMMLAAEIDRIRQIKLLLVDGKVSLFEHAGGYYLIRGDGTRVDLTSFVLTFDQNVIFADSGVYGHCGVMRFGSRQYPVAFLSHNFNSINAVEAAAREIEAKNKSRDLHGPIPTIRDHQSGRILLNYFRSAVECLPRREGIDGLGWTARRHGFFTPWGKLTAEDFLSDVRFPNPRYIFWDCFDLQTEPLMHDYDVDMPSGVADMISQIIGMIGRAHTDYSIRPVPILQNMESMRVARAIFKSLGQVQPYSFRTRESGILDIKGLHGFPLLISGATRSQIERAEQPLFALSDFGSSIYMDVSDADLTEKMRQIPRILTQCVKWIMQTSGSKLKIFNSVSGATALAREGAAIIRNACGIEWPESQPIYATVERLLNQIPFRRGAEFFTQHIRAQTVTIDLHGLQNVDATDLMLELQRSSKTVQIVDEQCTVDAISLMQLLEAFYGQLPPMTQIDLPDMHSRQG